MDELSGKAFLVAGATGALGSRIATRLFRRDARLTLAGRTASALSVLQIDGAHTVTADLREPDAPRMLVAAAAEHHGRLDGVVNAAGIVAFGPLTDIDDDTVDDLVLVDFLAPLRLLRAAAHAEARRRNIRVVDVRPPHTEAGLVNRAIAGYPPRLPTGLAPDSVADRIIAALLGSEADIPSSAF